MNKRAVIAGGSGFIGHHLADELKKCDYDVVVLSRTPKSGAAHREAPWDAKTVGEWAKEIDGADAVFNLTGAPIEKKWTPEYKQVLIDSRVESTRAIYQAIRASKNPPRVWVNSSAVGFYGDRGDEMVAESSPAGKGLLPEICKLWEDAFFEGSLPKTRRVAIRTGIVLGKDDGMFPILKSLTEKFLGGAAGSGKQWVSWIHVDDLVRLMTWAMDSNLEGPINGTAPNPVTNADLMFSLRAEIGRPPVPPTPPFMIKFASGLIGKEGSLILDGQRVHPVIARANGFKFRFDDIEPALANLNKN